MKKTPPSIFLTPLTRFWMGVLTPMVLMPFQKTHQWHFLEGVLNVPETLFFIKTPFYQHLIYQYHKLARGAITHPGTLFGALKCVWVHFLANLNKTLLRSVLVLDKKRPSKMPQGCFLWRQKVQKAVFPQHWRGLVTKIKGRFKTPPKCTKDVFIAPLNASMVFWGRFWGHKTA
jgi:hypothetical protein